MQKHLTAHADVDLPERVVETVAQSMGLSGPFSRDFHDFAQALKNEVVARMPTQPLDSAGRWQLEHLHLAALEKAGSDYRKDVASFVTDLRAKDAEIAALKAEVETLKFTYAKEGQLVITLESVDSGKTYRCQQIIPFPNEFTSRRSIVEGICGQLDETLRRQIAQAVQPEGAYDIPRMDAALASMTQETQPLRSCNYWSRSERLCSKCGQVHADPLP